MSTTINLSVRRVSASAEIRHIVSALLPGHQHTVSALIPASRGPIGPPGPQGASGNVEDGLILDGGNF